MIRFGLGLIVGVAIGAGGTWVMMKKPGEPDAKGAIKADAGAVASVGKGKKGKGKRGGGKRGGGVSGGGGGSGAGLSDEGGMDGEEDTPQIVLTDADLRLVTAGDALKVRSQSIDMSEGGAEVRDLSQSEIDQTFGGVTSDLIGCMDEARGGAPVVGTATFGVVADPEGRVIKTRVQAPAYLVTHGLYPCAKRVLGGLRFPAPGRDKVFSLPITLSQ